MKPLISVIVPVYRAEDYIEECINSISNQTYKNIEIILVNDGSPDKSGEICRKLKQADSRISVFDKENGGAASARNLGVQKASGEYIAFIDSDDIISPRYLEFLFDNLVRYDAEVSCCDYFETHYRNILIDSDKEISDENTLVLSGREACEKMMALGGNIVLISPCCKLCKSELIKENPFPEGHACEDEATCFKYYYFSRHVIMSNAKLYAYYQNPQSVMHGNAQKLHQDMLLAFKSRVEFFKGKNETHLEKIAINSLLSAHIAGCIQKGGKKSDELKKFAKEYGFSDKLLLKSKIKLAAFYLCPKLYIKFLNSL